MRAALASGTRAKSTKPYKAQKGKKQTNDKNTTVKTERPCGVTQPCEVRLDPGPGQRSGFGSRRFFPRVFDVFNVFDVFVVVLTLFDVFLTFC